MLSGDFEVDPLSSPEGEAALGRHPLDPFFPPSLLPEATDL